MKNRKTIRLEGYDYSENGCYFVTVCAQSREGLFGEIIGGGMVLSEAGRMVERTWNELPEFYCGIETDQFQVMPNHVHGVIVITENEFPHGTMSLSDIVHRFKSLTTHRYMANVKDGEWKPFERKLWQRSFYDRVIRDDDDLGRVREYIRNNPLKWALDEYNPANRAGE